MKKDDKRIQKTQKMLKCALCELLMEKEIHNITISELSNKINISRSTFYFHYDDIYDLYSKLESELFGNLDELLANDPMHNYMRSVDVMLDYIQSNAPIFRYFLCYTDNSTFRSKLSAYLEEKFMEITLYEMNTSKSNEDWNYLVRYHTGGIVAALTLWIETGFLYPKKRLLRMINRIDEQCDCLYE